MSATTKRFPQAHRLTATALALIFWLGAVAFTQISAASTVNPDAVRIAEIDQLLAQTFPPTPAQS